MVGHASVLPETPTHGAPDRGHQPVHAALSPVPPIRPG
jgi:hypothetical protein